MTTEDVVREEIARQTGQTSPTHGPVLVGIGDAALSEQRDAVDFAVSEANWRHSDLVLVHGCEPLVTLTALTPTMTPSERFSAGEGIVAVVAEYASTRLSPDRKIRTFVSEGSGAQALLDLADRAALIVCQRRMVSVAHRWHTGSTTSRLCARSEAPVAVIKQGGTHEAASGVVVGVDGRGHSAMAVDTAMVEAAVRGQQLTAVHAWEPPVPLGATGYVPPCDDELDLLRDRAAAVLADVLSDARVGETGVIVEPLVVRGPAAAALLDASRSAVLLVVSRHAGHGVGSLGLGSVARQVLGKALCPVIVTPPSRRPRRQRSVHHERSAAVP
ncbi:MAG TPA: universal stress protein [Microlunatus sp.]|nr:universal stress protein [Microlunatus sp.]